VNEGALAHVKVLDLTSHLAGPYCTKLLADYGAEVIKVERPDGGDPARRSGPFPGDVPHPEKSGRFLHLNTNKMGITLNLKTATGVKLLKELVKEADILVENFSPGVMDRLGLGYKVLDEINPRLVMTSISNFGQTGPYRDFKATELILAAVAGTSYSSAEGKSEREPLKYPGEMLQYLAGTTAAAATLMAYFSAQLKGVGQQVDVSIIEPKLGSADRMLLMWEYSKAPSTREGPRREGRYPNGVYPCRDGYVNFMASGDRFWSRITRMIGMPELAQDPRFRTTSDRMMHHGDFDAIFYPWLVEHTMLEIFEAAQHERVPCGAVYTADNLPEDPNYRARGFFVEIDHPVAGTFTYPGAPIKLGEGGWSLRRPAPTLGQHNEEVLCGRLGYSKEGLVQLRQFGVI